MAKPPTFNEEAEKTAGFLMACKLLIRIKMRNNLIEEQV